MERASSAESSQMCTLIITVAARRAPYEVLLAEEGHEMNASKWKLYLLKIIHACGTKRHRTLNTSYFLMTSVIELSFYTQCLHYSCIKFY